MTRADEFPLVTFAVFAYNQEAYVREAAGSALAQDYPNLQVILSDDCSTDGTWDVMREMAAGYAGPHRVTLNRNPANLGAGGLGAHVNRLVELALGELVVFSGGDDISHPHRTRSLVDAWRAAGYPSAALHSAVRVIDAAGAPLRELQGRASFEGLDVPAMVRTGGKGVLGASLAATRDLYARFGPLDPQAWFEDRTTAFRAFLAGRILYVPSVLLDYRVHGESMTSPRNYADRARWARWIDGTLNVFAHFRRDYLTARAGRAADPRVLAAIRREERYANRARDLHHSGRLRRGWAAWTYARDASLRGRTAFALECAGLMDSPPIRWLRRIFGRNAR